jgi:hypothetical protein
MRVRQLGTRYAPNSIRDLVSRVVRGHAPSISIVRREIPYWRERGWTRDGNHYTGSYQTPHAAFQGWIEDQRSGPITFYLRSPSPQIRSHSHWACFAPRNDDWFLVHMAKRPNDVSSGILTIERLIADAYQR